jgi:hypothetical protein
MRSRKAAAIPLYDFGLVQTQFPWIENVRKYSILRVQNFPIKGNGPIKVCVLNLGRLFGFNMA